MTRFQAHCSVARLIFCLLLLVCLVTPARGDDVDRQRQSLKEIQSRIDRLSKQLVSSREREGEVQKELAQLDKELSGLQKNSNRLQTRLSGLNNDIGNKENRAEILKKDISEREQYVRRRLGALYRRGEMRLFKVLFEKGSPSQLAENFFYLTRLVRQDRELLTKYREDWGVLRDSLQELEQLRSEQQRRLNVLDASHKLLDKGRQTHKSALNKLRQNRTELSGEIAGLKEKAQRLRNLLKTLETAKSREYSGASKAAAGNFKQQKGALPWPGQGKLMVRFGTNFNEDLGTRYESQGIELSQTPGSPIHAVASGKVVFAKPFRGFGNLLILDHGGGYYTLYAQASQLVKKVGDMVAAGDNVGLSGFGDSKTIYFEIRQRGTPLDPLQWLKPR